MQVVFGKFEFALASRPFVTRCGQAGAKEINQTIEHQLRRTGVATDQRPQIGQGVKQHMRIDLRAQQLQLRFGQLPRYGFATLALKRRLRTHQSIAFTSPKVRAAAKRRECGNDQ